MANNFERMLELVGDFFDVKNDPDQISVDEASRHKLEQIHPATLNELANEDGPMVWILVVPTTLDTMQRFLNKAITEQQLLDETQPGTAFEAVYLCSASVLPEFRGKGLAKKVTLDAIRQFQEKYRIKALYFWKFSKEGDWLAKAIARDTALPLYER